MYIALAVLFSENLVYVNIFLLGRVFATTYLAINIGFYNFQLQKS
jgi:hypothetical protein